ncbi:MAG: hypothetical protein ACREPC_05090, partial [Stenotrophomonas sp.]
QFACALTFRCVHLPEMMSLFMGSRPWLQRHLRRTCRVPQRVFGGGQAWMKRMLTSLNGGTLDRA